MFTKIRLKKLIAWNFFILSIILLFIFGYANTKKKHDFESISGPEFAYYIENTASPDEIREIAISHSKALFSAYENQYKFNQLLSLFIAFNLILLVNENLKQRPRKPENLQRNES